MTNQGIIIKNKRTKIENLKKLYPEAVIIDVTSTSMTEHVKFSPFYPHGQIPIPFSEGHFAKSVEGIWQGLKVFANAGVDISKFDISNMKNIKRSTRKNGQILGHQRGLNSKELLAYYDARCAIYLPTYEFILSNYLPSLISNLKEITQQKNLILLDYETNEDISNTSKPLSHAALIKNYLEKI